MQEEDSFNLKTWEECRKAFLKILPQVSTAHSARDIFVDACRIFSLSLRGAVTLQKEEKETIEKQYQSFVTKYGPEGMTKISHLLGITIQALSIKRSDFLGHVYEELNATVKSFGQFFTPDSVAKLMARITFGDLEAKPGKIVKIGDPACGAGALLIEAAESFIENGGRQGDLLIFGEDLDATACCIFYVQASLLGYAAVVSHQDSLSRTTYEGPWYTPCYFAHGMPMRLLAELHRKRMQEIEAKEDSDSEESVEAAEGTGDTEPVNIRNMVQGELSL